MLSIVQLDPSNPSHVRRFVRFPFQLFHGDRLWVPPLRVEHEEQLDRRKHPFYEHSHADFFIAERDGRDVGRIAAIENTRFNQHHRTRKAQFYFFDCQDDPEAAARLFETARDWARRRNLDTIVGPKGFGPLDAYGIQIDGFNLRPMMTMMNYNPPYYPALLEQNGFEKEVDFISVYADLKIFRFPDWIEAAAAKVEARGWLRVKSFASIKELKTWAGRIGEAYNRAFVNNWEYYPLTEREVAFVVEKLQTIADPRLIKIILHEEEVVGFLFAFPDLANALRRSRGRLFPFGLLDLLLEMRRTRWAAVNTAGVLPQFQGRGGNALLYTELEKIRRQGRYDFAALYQVAETATSMRRDLEHMGGVAFKNHRVYVRKVD